MADYGVTPQGFKRKRYETIIESMNTRARNTFGENINLSERSPLGLFFRVIAWSLSILWQLAENVYFSGYKDTAEGISLDYVAKYIGIERRQAQRAIGEITITGTNGTIIPIGFITETEGGIQFQTTEETTIASGVAQVLIISVVPGISGNVPAETITVITNPIAGVESVINLEPTTNGRNVEADSEFRDRYDRSVAKGGASTLDSIRSSLLELDGVRASLVVENNTMVEDSEGRPPKSIECYVLGGNSTDIGRSILDTKAAGIEPHGTESVVVADNAGTDHIIKFTYATEVPIYANVSITKNSKYPIDGDNQVKTALIKYIGGTDEDSNVYTGLGMGDDVIYTKLISIIYSIPGIDDVELQVGTNGFSYSSSNISVTQAQVAETDHTKVVVTSA